jgi:hypothetical protein
MLTTSLLIVTYNTQLSNDNGDEVTVSRTDPKS